MHAHDIVVVGFSAEGVEPLVKLVVDLSPDLPASLFVVHHSPAQSVSALPDVLGRVASLPVAPPTTNPKAESRGVILVMEEMDGRT